MLHLRPVPNRALLPMLRLDAPGHIFPLLVAETVPDATSLAACDDAGAVRGVLVTGKEVRLFQVGGWWLLAEDDAAAALLLTELARRDPYAEVSYPLWARAAVRRTFPAGRDSIDALYICTLDTFRPHPPPPGLRVAHLSPTLYAERVRDPLLRAFIGDIPADAALPPDYPFFVLVDDAAVAIADATLRTVSASAVMGVATAPAVRGRGYAKAIVAAATAAILQCGHPAVYLVNEANTASIAVCTAIGYTLHRRYGYLYHAPDDGDA